VFVFRAQLHPTSFVAVVLVEVEVVRGGDGGRLAVNVELVVAIEVAAEDLDSLEMVVVVEEVVAIRWITCLC